MMRREFLKIYMRVTGEALMVETTIENTCQFYCFQFCKCHFFKDLLILHSNWNAKQGHLV